MIDVSLLKKQLSVDDIISLLGDMGADYSFLSDKEIHFRSICHNSQSFKLYYYIESQSFYCHRCGKSWDIIALIEQIKNLSFREAIDYVCRLCHITETYAKQKPFIDDWQSMKKYLPNSNYVEMPTIYHTDEMALFSPLYHQSWLDDGITLEAMQKFDIGWYARNKQITIPVLDADGKLIGIHGRNTSRALVEKGYKYIPVKTLNNHYKFPTNSVLYGLFQNKSAIQETKEVCLFEAPKSVLQFESIQTPNIAVAMFGMNLNRYRADMLLQLGVENVNICLDKQYQQWRDDEWMVWKEKVKKIAKLFNGLANVYVVCDTTNLLQYKQSPTDNGVNIWNKLYKERMMLN